MSTRYEATREAFFFDLALYVVRWGVFVSVIWFLIHVNLNLVPPDRDAVFGVVLFLALLSPFLVVSLVARIKKRPEHLAVVLGNEWIELPVWGRIPFSNIQEVKVKNGLLHPRVLIVFSHKRDDSLRTIAIYPHRFSSGKSLRKSLTSLNLERV